MKKLCSIRDIQRSIRAFEQRFEHNYGICLNEGMALCSLHEKERLSSGELRKLLGLTPSNTSKIIASIERKKLIKRDLGETDKRQMYFSLTPEGQKLITSIRCDSFEIPQPLLHAIQKETFTSF